MGKASAEVMTRPEFSALDKLLVERHSCRAFLNRPVGREIIEAILLTAQRTASWCNTQPWSVFITEGGATRAFKDGLKQWRSTHQAAPDFPFPERYQHQYLARRRECGFQLYASVGVSRGDHEAALAQTDRNFDLFGAPHVAIVASPAELGTYGAIDCGAYVSTFMLAAHALGVSSIAQASLAGHADFIHSHFSMEPDKKVICGIAFGFEDLSHPSNGFRTSRASLNETALFISTPWPPLDPHEGQN